MAEQNDNGAQTQAKARPPQTPPAPTLPASAQLENPPEVVRLTHTKPGTGLQAGIPLRGFDDAWRLATIMASSGMVPKAYDRKPEAVMVAVQFGAELGLGPMAAVQNIAVINGAPSVWGPAIMALCQAHPMFVSAGQNWDADAEVATVWMERKGMGRVERTFSMEEARRIEVKTFDGIIKLADKDTYRNYPADMCLARALGRVAKFLFADAMKGLQIAQEQIDRVWEGDFERVLDEASELTDRIAERAAAGPPPGVDENGEEVTLAALEKELKSCTTGKEINALLARSKALADPGERGAFRKKAGAAARSLAAGSESEG